MAGKYQIEFVKFPGVKPWTSLNGWDHLPLPWRTVPAEPEDEEIITDAVMEMVDWAIQERPELFGLDLRTDYEEANDKSLELLEVIMAAIDHPDKQPCPGGVLAEWYSDAQLSDDITVRVGYFAR